MPTTSPTTFTYYLIHPLTITHTTSPTQTTWIICDLHSLPHPPTYIYYHNHLLTLSTSSNNLRHNTSPLPHLHYLTYPLTPTTLYTILHPPSRTLYLSIPTNLHSQLHPPVHLHLLPHPSTYTHYLTTHLHSLPQPPLTPLTPTTSSTHVHPILHHSTHSHYFMHPLAPPTSPFKRNRSAMT